jgi:hypothetical protein
MESLIFRLNWVKATLKLSHWLRGDNQFLSGMRLAMVNSFGYLSLFSLLWQNMERFTISIEVPRQACHC